ncbi:hypothetical protein ANCCEY_06317 [Ancylostoma ceylanicum]|nr:hypothetical protein ANCCEY_06317 [Ancylostoma ceylanicum]
MLLLLISLVCIAAAEECPECPPKSTRERLCFSSYVSRVVSKGEDKSLGNQYLRVYLVEHKEVFKNSTELPTKIVTPRTKCGLRVTNGTEFLIAGSRFSSMLYPDRELYMDKCDLRKQWNKVDEKVKAGLNSYLSGDYTCPIVDIDYIEEDE